MAEDKELHKALKSAFEVCHTMSDVLGNVIAGSEKGDPATKQDKALKKEADIYVKWYRKTFNQS